MTEQRLSFNSVAEQYDASRPGYPPEVFEHLVAVAGLRPGDRVLDVGCGTGLATAGLLRFGLDVTAIDPGEDMIAVARRRLGSEPRLLVTGFEAFRAEPGSYAAVLSAQAWHWIPEAVSYRKAAEILRPGGALLILGNVLGAPPPDLMQAFEPIYRRYAPALWAGPGDDWYRPAGPIRDLIAASGCFQPAQHRGWTWTEMQSADRFIARLGTISAYLLLPDAVRGPLFRELTSCLESFGGRIPLSHETHLYWARRYDEP